MSTTKSTQIAGGGQYVPMTDNVTVDDGVLGIIATLTLTPMSTGRFMVLGSSGPGALTAMTSGGILVLWNTAGGGLSGAHVIDAKAMSASGPELQGASASGVATGLTVGTSYDFYIAVIPTGDAYKTEGVGSVGPAPLVQGGLYVVELP